jgi:prepilin-type N-terminal cleavage/methylation domain-containing protein
MATPSQRWRSPQNRRVSADTGFTLVELLLVLAILAGMAALVVPSFSGLLADRGLARAGDQLRVAMMQARLSAMRSGRTYMMQFRQGSGELRTLPWVDMNDMTEAADQTGASSALLTGGNLVGGTMRAVDIESETRNAELPPATTIAEVNIQSSPRSFLIETQMQAQASNDWGQPILFYPDGSTSTAAVTMQSEQVGRVVVLLRGLTGEPTVTDIFAPIASGGGS